jgi:hypothetical protein
VQKYNSLIWGYYSKKTNNFLPNYLKLIVLGSASEFGGDFGREK